MSRTRPSHAFVRHLAALAVLAAGGCASETPPPPAASPAPAAVAPAAAGARRCAAAPSRSTPRIPSYQKTSGISGNLSSVG